MKDPAVRTRVLMLAALLAVAFGGLTARLGWLMVVKLGELRVATSISSWRMRSSARPRSVRTASSR